jgi:ABC-type Fe3+-hydroxamate transport system substrate-binding protein
MKKVLALILAAMLAVAVTGCTINTSSASSGSKASAAKASAKDSGNLGDYALTIESARLSKDYKDNPVVVVKYKFTNNGEKAASFITSIGDTAFQDGVELETSVLSDEDMTSGTQDSMKDVKKGVTVEVENAYILKNKTSKIEVEACEAISLNEDKLEKTFDPATLK